MDEAKIFKELLLKKLKGEITQEQLDEACEKWRKKVENPLIEKIKEEFGGEEVED